MCVVYDVILIGVGIILVDDLEFMVCIDFMLEK